jgi:hypothetical protein
VKEEKMEKFDKAVREKSAMAPWDFPHNLKPVTSPSLLTS